MKPAPVKSIQVTLPARTAADLQRLARSWQTTPRKAALKAIEQRAAQLELDATVPYRRRLAKKLGIKSEEDVYQFLGE